MSQSSSKSASSSSTTYNTETNNLNLQGIDGLAIAGVEGSTINVLDNEAIRNSFDFARDSGEVFSDAANKSLDRAFDFALDTLGRADRAVSAAQQTSERALVTALGQTSQALESKSDVEAGGAQRLLVFAVVAVAGSIALVYVMNR